MANDRQKTAAKFLKEKLNTNVFLFETSGLEMKSCTILQFGKWIIIKCSEFQFNHSLNFLVKSYSLWNKRALETHRASNDFEQAIWNLIWWGEKHYKLPRKMKFCEKFEKTVILLWKFQIFFPLFSLTEVNCLSIFKFSKPLRGTSSNLKRIIYGLKLRNVIK